MCSSLIFAFIVTCVPYAFAQKSQPYFLMGIQFDDVKHPGARVNVGISSVKESNSGFGIGIGLEAIGYNNSSTGYHSNAFPLYIDLRYYLPASFTVFLEGNAGTYNQSAKSSLTNFSSDGGFLKTDTKTKGHGYLGANIGLVLPSKKMKKRNGATITIGYRFVKYNNNINTEERVKTGSDFTTTKSASIESSNGSWANIAIGFSI